MMGGYFEKGAWIEDPRPNYSNPVHIMNVKIHVDDGELLKALEKAADLRDIRRELRAEGTRILQNNGMVARKPTLWQKIKSFLYWGN